MNCFELCIVAARHYRDFKNKKSCPSTYEKIQKIDICDAEIPARYATRWSIQSLHPFLVPLLIIISAHIYWERKIIICDAFFLQILPNLYHFHPCLTIF